MKTVVLIAVALWLAYILGFITAALLAAAGRRDCAPPLAPVPPRPDFTDPETYRLLHLNRWPEDPEADR